MSDGQSETQAELLTPRERLERAGWNVETYANLLATNTSWEWKACASPKARRPAVCGWVGRFFENQIVVECRARTEAAALAALAERCGV